MSRRCQCSASRTCQPTTLAAALDHTARRSTRSAEQIAAAMGRKVHWLTRATNPDCDELHFPALELESFMRAAESILPLQVLARELGCAVVALPEVATADDIHAAFLRAVSELGEDSEVIRASLADHVITPEEGAGAGRSIDATISALLAVKAAVLARVAIRPAMARMQLEQPLQIRRQA